MRVLRDSDNKKWIILRDENDGIRPYECYYGEVFLHTLNILNQINSDRITESNYDSSELEAIHWLKTHKNYWEKIYKEIDDAINKKNSFSTKKKYDLLETYGMQLINVFRAAYGYEPVNRSSFTLKRFALYKNNVYEQLEMIDENEIMYFDLKECLFGSLRNSIRKCSNCNDYTIFKTGKHKYCDECQKILGKIKYDKRNSDPVQKIIKKTQDTLGKRKDVESGNKLAVFNIQANYYRDKVRGKEPTPLPEFDDIKMETDNDLLDWAEKYYDSIRIYNKKGSHTQ